MKGYWKSRTMWRAWKSGVPLQLIFVLLYYFMWNLLAIRWKKHVMGLAELTVRDTLWAWVRNTHLQSVSRATDEVRRVTHLILNRHQVSSLEAFWRSCDNQPCVVPHRDITLVQLVQFWGHIVVWAIREHTCWRTLWTGTNMLSRRYHWSLWVS